MKGRKKTDNPGGPFYSEVQKLKRLNTKRKFEKKRGDSEGRCEIDSQCGRDSRRLGHKKNRLRKREHDL